MFDFLLTASMMVIFVGPYLSSSYGSGLAVLGFLMVAPLLVRRRFPRVALALMVVAGLAQVVYSPEPLASITAVPIMIYTAARWGGQQLGRIALFAGLAGAAIGPFRWIFGGGIYTASAAAFVMTVFACAATVVGAYLLGSRRREWSDNSRQRAQSEHERRQLMIAEQEQRVRMMTVTERQRIARELHDIVAHSLSVIVVQAEGGKALAAKRPERAPEVLGTIAETSREALEEMRRMVGLLRNGPEPEQAAYVPTPGLTDLPELVRKTSESAQLVTYGEPPVVSPALGLTAYRIVQESLTNVLKHAGPTATARVTAAYTAQSIELEIADDGRGAAATGDGMGHGLRGMHERVALHHGRLTAAPRPAGGFSVRASLPLSSEPSLQRPVRVPPARSPGGFQ